MANYTINNAGSTTCNYPSTVNVGDVLTFNITNTTITTKYRGSMLTYTFPCDCTAEILAAGAKGGDGAGGGAGGRGAIVAGTLSFKTGDQLLICVGQAGTSGTLSSGSDGTTGAGGGGTYVVRKVSNSSYRYTASGTGYNWYVEPLVIGAGGNGGGDNLWSGNVTIHANSSNGNENGFSYAASYYGGGFSNCAVTDYSSTTGRSFLTGAQGATDAFNRGGTSYAGFGGGGGNEDDSEYGGGGGGFTGGYAGTGATSYVTSSASNISRKSSSSGNNGEGYVKITFKTVVPPVEFPPTEIVTQAGFDAKVKVNNAWKDGEKGYVKVDNTWKEIAKMYTKVNNTWVLTGEERSFFVYTLLYQGYLNDKTIIGGYNGTATYSAYTAGTGITLSVAAKPVYGAAYPAAAGNFVNIVTSKIKTVTFDYQRTTGSTSFDIGIYISSTAQSGRLNSTTINSLTKAVQTVNSSSGTITIDLEEVFGDALATYTNYYLGLYLYQSDGTATTVVIKNMTYAEEHVENEGGGTTPPPATNSVYLVQNGVVNNNTEFGALASTVVTDLSSTGSGISMTTNSNSSTNYCIRFSFNKKVDMSKIEKIIVQWKFTDVELVGKTGEITVGYYSSTFTTQGSTINYQNKISKSIDLTKEWINYTAEFVPTNWTGENYLSFAVRTTFNGTALTLFIPHIEIVYKDGTSSGGATQTATLRLSDMYSADLYSSDWLNISSAYDNSSTTYAYLVLNGIITNYQALIFNSNGIALNSANITKATLYLDAIYYLTSGSGPNVGVTVRSMGQNDIIKNIQEFHDITTTTVIDITNYISNSINYSGNVELVFETYNMNSSGVLGQVRMHEAYIELEYSTEGSGSGGSGGSDGSDYYIVRNGAYETTNVFKRQFLMGTGDWVDTVVPNSNGNLKFNLTTGTNNNNQCVVYYYTDTIDVTNYNKLVIDASFSYSTSRGDGIAVGIGTLYEVDDTVYVEPDPDSYLTTGNNLQNGINEIDISNITGDRVICMQVMSGSYSGSAAINIYMKDLYLTVAGGSTGGGTGSGTGLTITQGYVDDGEYVTSSNYESIVTEKVNVKSLSNTTSFAFTVTSSTYIYAKAYFEVWSSDGTQGTFVGYADLGYYDFDANSPTPITISKNELAYDLDLSSGYDIGHVALSLNADPIYARNFTITFGSGVTPRDDI